MSRFENQCALVTGAAGGIGKAIARQLREQGARVAVAEISTTGIEAEVHLPGDLRDHGYVDSLGMTAFNELGGLDIVVNNAGIITK